MTNRLKLTDDEAGISIDMTVSPDLPEGTAARRFGTVLELIKYHTFQSRGSEHEPNVVDETEPRSVPQLIQEIKRVHGISQDEIAARLGVSPTTVSLWATEVHEPRVESRQELEEMADGEDATLD